MTAPAAYQDPDDLQAGTLLLEGRLRIIGRIGKGGWSTVYRAILTEPKTEVALKIIASQQLEPEARQTSEERFRNEMSFAAALGAHPNIVRPLDMGRVPELGNRLYMLQELVKGPALRDLILGERLSMLRACSLIRDIANALVELHDRGIIHRDVKSSNIMVTSIDGVEQAKLLDFGYAYAQKDAVFVPKTELTQAHERPGTKHYMAPEQAAGAPPAPSFDVYALAVTLHEALAGHVPYHTHSPQDVVIRKCNPSEPSFSIEGKRPGLLPELAELVDEGLARKPEERLPSARAFRDRLDQILEILRADQPREVQPEPKIIAANAQRAQWRGDDTSIGAGTLFEHAVAGSSAVLPAPAVSPASDEGPRSLSESSAPTKSFPWPRLVIGLIVAFAITGGMLEMLSSADAEEKSEVRASSSDPQDSETQERRDIAKREEQKLQSDVNPAPPAPREEPATERLTPPEQEPSEAPVESPDTEGPSRPTPKDASPAPKRPAQKSRRAEPNARPEPQAKPKAHESQECEALRARVDAAVAGVRWSEALELVKRRECWASKAYPQTIRIQALANLGRFKECANAARSFTPSAAAPFAKLCASRVEKETNP